MMRARHPDRTPRAGRPATSRTGSPRLYLLLGVAAHVRAGALARRLVVQDAGGASGVPARPVAAGPEADARRRATSKALPASPGDAPDGSAVEPRMLRRIGMQGQFVDPAGARRRDRTRADDAPRGRCASCDFAWENYVEPLRRFRFDRFLANSVFVTVVSTAMTLIINSMCAFALSKYSSAAATRSSFSSCRR